MAVLSSYKYFSACQKISQIIGTYCNIALIFFQAGNALFNQKAVAQDGIGFFCGFVGFKRLAQKLAVIDLKTAYQRGIQMQSDPAVSGRL